jgi:hypothetical protein
LISAEGELPTPGFEVDIAQSPLRIFPPQFNLLRCSRPGVWPQVFTPYRYAETVRFPADQSTMTVRHAEGSDLVSIEDCGRYTGRSSATRDESTRIERVHPIRSAITVAGIVGYAANSSRIRGSTASTIDPFPGR